LVRKLIVANLLILPKNIFSSGINVENFYFYVTRHNKIVNFFKKIGFLVIASWVRLQDFHFKK
jgi:hypothetical protein